MMREYIHSFSSIDELAGEKIHKKNVVDLLKHIIHGLFQRRKLQNGI